jgi:hypothetical protein
MANDRSLNFEHFKQFVRLGHGREILLDFSTKHYVFSHVENKDFKTLEVHLLFI